MTTASPLRAIDALPTERQFTYADQQLHALVKQLRAAVRPHPSARRALERLEMRLKYTLRVVECWDRSHADRAALLLSLGNIAAANGAASLIFDDELRHSLLRQCFIGLDSSTDERIAEALQLEREVLG